jgi:ankyrin repeat protein
MNFSPTSPKLIVWVLLFGGLLVDPAYGQQVDGEVDFARDIAPILQTHCVQCHNPSLELGHLVLTSHESVTSADVIVPGDVDESLLLQRLSNRDLGILMPPTGSLSKSEIDRLTTWVRSGATWPDGVVLQAETDASPQGSFEGIFKLLRDGDQDALSQIVRNGDALGSKDRNGATPLAYAAMYANPSAVQMLSNGGADPNVADKDGITPLMLAVTDVEKVRMLLEQGASVDAETKLGRRALLLAAASAGNSDVLFELFKAGADLQYTDRRGWTALSLAARTGDSQMLEMILRELERLDADSKESIGKALAEAARVNDLTSVQLLLKHGANQDQQAMNASLVYAATHGNLQMARSLLESGANPQSTFQSSFATPASPLLAATYCEETSTDLVELFLFKSVDLKQKEKHGKTAFVLAQERGADDVLKLLRAAGDDGLLDDISLLQTESPANEKRIEINEFTIRKLIQKSTALLQSCDAVFYARSGCVACHQHTASALVVSAARSRGFDIDEQAQRQQLKLTSIELAQKRSTFLQRIKSGGAAHRFGYLLWGLAVSDYPADEFTDATYHELAGLQRLDGSWFSDAYRPPSEYSPVTATAVALRAIKHYSPPGRKASTEERIERATQWLESARPNRNVEKAFRLLGLYWGGASKEVRSEVSKDLLNDQDAGGGWSQLPGLEPDAYATGLTLYALSEAGGMPVSRPEYRRGVEFLVRTCNDDGSWHVASRSFKFQPYFESGFPHGEDQWISAAATGWATLALLNTLPQPNAK